MKVLLVGGLGFIGKHLIRKLGDSTDLSVITFAETLRRNENFVDEHSLRVEVCDIGDGTRLKEIMLQEKPEVVVHLAALTGLTKCSENPSQAFSTNVYGTYNVVMACVAARSRLVFVSSKEVYGETLSGETREDEALVPNNLYGLTKLMAERLIMWAAQKHGLDYVILRVTNVYGPEGGQYNVLAMIRKAASDGRIDLFGGNQRLNLIYVEDVVEAIQKSLTGPQASRQIFNVGSHDNLTVQDVVERIVSVLGTSIRIDRKPMRAGETLNFKPSLERVVRVLGWTPRTSFSEGVKRTVEWYRQQQGSR